MQQSILVHKNIFSKYNKCHIKHMLVMKRPYKRKNVVDIAILLDNNQYIEYSLSFKQMFLTFWVIDRIQTLFSRYYIDSKTDVMVNDLLDQKHPMYMYLNILKPHIQYKMRIVSIDQIVSRIYYFFKGKAASKTKLNFVWKKTIEKEICPWITQQVDYALQNKMNSTMNTMKILRLGIFYIVIKNYLYKSVEKCRKRKMMNLEKENEDKNANDV